MAWPVPPHSLFKRVWASHFNEVKRVTGIIRAIFYWGLETAAGVLNMMR